MKNEIDIPKREVLKTVTSPVRNFLNELRGDYLECTTTERDLFGTIKSYNAYKHLQIDMKSLLDFLNQNVTIIESTDISIFELYLELMLDTIDPRVEFLYNQIQKLKEERK